MGKRKIAVLLICILNVVTMRLSAQLAYTLGYFADETGSVAPDFVNVPNWVLLFASFALIVATLAIAFVSKRSSPRVFIIFFVLSACLVIGALTVGHSFKQYAAEKYGWTGPVSDGYPAGESRTPLSGIDADDVEFATVFAVPPEETITVTESAVIVGIVKTLNEIVLLRPAVPAEDGVGQSTTVTLSMRSGEEIIVSEFGSYITLTNGVDDHVTYEAVYESAEALNALVNVILNTPFSEIVESFGPDAPEDIGTKVNDFISNKYSRIETVDPEDSSSGVKNVQGADPNSTGLDVYIKEGSVSSMGLTIMYTNNSQAEFSETHDTAVLEFRIN